VTQIVLMEPMATAWSRRCRAMRLYIRNGKLRKLKRPRISCVG